MKSLKELIVKEDQNKKVSVMVHYKKMMDTLFANEKTFDGLIKDSISVSYSLTASDNSCHGGISGWIAYDFAIVEAIWIEQSLQQNGHGKSLLEKFEKEALANNCYRILTSTNNLSESLPFWLKNGFEILHTLETKETGFTIHYLHKILGS